MSASVSVVINNHNYGRFVGQAIDSALSQTIPVEVIVVDDGSTDDSGEVIEAYARRVTVIRKENGGQASALNAGWRASRGEVVCFLDADDLLLPDAAALAAAELTRGPAVKVHWPLEEIDSQGRPLGRLRPSSPLPQGDLREAVITGGPDAYTMTPTSANAWRRTLLEAVMPIDEDAFRLGADGYLLAIAPLRGPVARVERPLGRYRLHGANHSAAGRFAGRLDTGLRIYAGMEQAILRECRAQGVDADPAAWRASSYWHRLCSIAEDLERLVGPTGFAVLADDGQLGMDASAPGRPRPLIGRGGEDWGPPVDDDQAICALESARADGATLLAFAWPAFWWLEHYTRLREHVEARYARVLDDDRLVAFSLAGP